MSFEIIWIYIYQKIYDKISKIWHFFYKNPLTPVMIDFFYSLLFKDSPKNMLQNYVIRYFVFLVFFSLITLEKFAIFEKYNNHHHHRTSLEDRFGGFSS